MHFDNRNLLCCNLQFGRWYEYSLSCRISHIAPDILISYSAESYRHICGVLHTNILKFSDMVNVKSILKTLNYSTKNWELIAVCGEMNNDNAFLAIYFSLGVIYFYSFSMMGVKLVFIIIVEFPIKTFDNCRLHVVDAQQPY